MKWTIFATLMRCYRLLCLLNFLNLCILWIYSVSHVRRFNMMRFRDLVMCLGNWLMNLSGMRTLNDRLWLYRLLLRLLLNIFVLLLYVRLLFFFLNLEHLHLIKYKLLKEIFWNLHILTRQIIIFLLLRLLRFCLAVALLLLSLHVAHIWLWCDILRSRLLSHEARQARLIEILWLAGGHHWLLVDHGHLEGCGRSRLRINRWCWLIKWLGSGNRSGRGCYKAWLSTIDEVIL